MAGVYWCDNCCDYIRATLCPGQSIDYSTSTSTSSSSSSYTRCPPNPTSSSSSSSSPWARDVWIKVGRLSSSSSSGHYFKFPATNGKMLCYGVDPAGDQSFPPQGAVVIRNLGTTYPTCASCLSSSSSSSTSSSGGSGDLPINEREYYIGTFCGVGSKTVYVSYAGWLFFYRYEQSTGFVSNPNVAAVYNSGAGRWEITITPPVGSGIAAITFYQSARLPYFFDEGPWTPAPGYLPDGPLAITIPGGNIQENILLYLAPVTDPFNTGQNTIPAVCWTNPVSVCAFTNAYTLTLCNNLDEGVYTVDPDDPAFNGWSKYPITYGFDYARNVWVFYVDPVAACGCTDKPLPSSSSSSSSGYRKLQVCVGQRSSSSANDKLYTPTSSAPGFQYTFKHTDNLCYSYDPNYPIVPLPSGGISLSPSPTYPTCIKCIGGKSATICKGQVNTKKAPKVWVPNGTPMPTVKTSFRVRKWCYEIDPASTDAELPAGALVVNVTAGTTYDSCKTCKCSAPLEGLGLKAVYCGSASGPGSSSSSSGDPGVWIPVENLPGQVTYFTALGGCYYVNPANTPVLIPDEVPEDHIISELGDSFKDCFECMGTSSSSSSSSSSTSGGGGGGSSSSSGGPCDGLCVTVVVGGITAFFPVIIAPGSDPPVYAAGGDINGGTFGISFSETEDGLWAATMIFSGEGINCTTNFSGPAAVGGCPPTFGWTVISYDCPDGFMQLLGVGACPPPGPGPESSSSSGNSSSSSSTACPNNVVYDLIAEPKFGGTIKTTTWVLHRISGTTWVDDTGVATLVLSGDIWTLTLWDATLECQYVFTSDVNEGGCPPDAITFSLDSTGINCDGAATVG